MRKYTYTIIFGFIGFIFWGLSYFEYFELYELILSFVQKYEKIELDELLILLIFIMIGRFFDYRIEKEKHKIKFENYREDVTQLHNQKYFIDKLKESLKISAKKNYIVAVVVVEIKEFETIYNNLTNFGGDRLLINIGKRLEKYTYRNDEIAHTTEGEFKILVTKVKNIEDVKEIVDKIASVFEKPFVIDEHELLLKTRIGVSVYPNDGEEANILINKALVAKSHVSFIHNDEQIEFYSEELNEEIKKKFLLERQLYTALDKEELYLNYQPIIDAQTGKIVACEALLRWENSEFGFIPPDVFIPIAEGNNSIISIGEWVMKTACKQNKKWQDERMSSIYVAVNVSIIQLRKKGFVDMVKKILKETELGAQYLEIEITESIPKNDIDEIIKLIKELKEIGIKVSIDDFGTGYSNFSQLRELSFNTLKIDKSFIDNIDNIKGCPIVSIVIMMAKKLGLRIVAEGVETKEQLEFLKEKKCDMIQGYLISKPVNSEEFKRLIVKK